MNISNYEELQDLELRIFEIIKRFYFEAVLIGVRELPEDIPKFAKAGICLFAVKFCASGPKIDKIRAVAKQDMLNIADLVMTFLLADPSTFEGEDKIEDGSVNPVFVIRRLAHNQFPFNIGVFSQHARPLMLYNKIPSYLRRDGLPLKFDIPYMFEKKNNYTVEDFIDVAFVLHQMAKNRKYFTRSDFEYFRETYKIPEIDTVTKIFNSISGDIKKLGNLYYSHRNQDRKFGMYDLNPLLLCPVVRPWEYDEYADFDRDRIIVPLPDLIAYRMSTGIYYELFNEFGTKFSDAFGYVFEEYIGWILRESIPPDRLMSEKQILEEFPQYRGAIPDWIVFEEDSVIIIECKATKLSLSSILATDEESIKDGLKQLLKGLRQLNEFRTSIMDNIKNNNFIRASKVVSIIITFEPLYLAGSELYKKYINDQIGVDGIPEIDWAILSMRQLEVFQAHIKRGVKLEDIVERLRQKNHTDVLLELNQTNKITYKDCCLYSVQEEIYRRIGADDDID